MQDRLQAEHEDQEDRQKDTGKVLPIKQVLGKLQISEPLHVPRFDVLQRLLRMVVQTLPHAEDVDEHPACKYSFADGVTGLVVAILGTQIVQNGLRQDEDDKCEQEPCFSVQESPEGNPAPDQVGHHRQQRVAYDLWVPAICDPLDRWSEGAVGVDDEVLNVVVHATPPVLRHPRTPDQAVQQVGHQGRRIEAQAFDDVGMPLEQDVVAIVIAVPVCADGQQVLDDAFCGVKAAGLDGPEQWRDRLRAHLDIEHPKRSLSPGCA
mmetsp:Transcript_1970/g.5555  ORF Transcript_1970/g.5555 Transcript_1970/m.5555 type:complete len:264 (-) Transcript_1970:343-1134(-)